MDLQPVIDALQANVEAREASAAKMDQRKAELGDRGDTEAAIKHLFAVSDHLVETAALDLAVLVKLVETLSEDDETAEGVE